MDNKEIETLDENERAINRIGNEKKGTEKIKSEKIEKANKNYIRRKKYRRYAYRIPYLIIYIVAMHPFSVGGLITLLIYASISELLIMALTKREKVIERKIKNGDYIIKEDVVKDIYLKDIDPQEPSKGYFKYMSFVDTKVAYSHENVYRFEIGEKVILQIVKAKHNGTLKRLPEEEIINVFKVEEDV